MKNITITQYDKYFQKYIYKDIIFPDSNKNISELIIFILNYLEVNNIKDKDKIINKINNFINKVNNIINIDSFIQFLTHIDINVYDYSKEYINKQIYHNKYTKIYNKNIIFNNTNNILINVYIIKTKSMLDVNNALYFICYSNKHYSQSIILDLFYYYIDKSNINVDLSYCMQDITYYSFGLLHNKKHQSQHISKLFAVVDIETVAEYDINIDKKTHNINNCFLEISKFFETPGDVDTIPREIIYDYKHDDQVINIKQQKDIFKTSDNHTDNMFHDNKVERILYIGFFIGSFYDENIIVKHNITNQEIFYFFKHNKYLDANINQKKKYFINYLSKKIIIEFFKNSKSNHINRKKIITLLTKLNDLYSGQHLLIYSINGSRFDHVLLMSFLMKLFDVNNEHVQFINESYKYISSTNSLIRFSIYFYNHNKYFFNKRIKLEFRDFSKLCNLSLSESCNAFYLNKEISKMSNLEFSIEKFRYKFDNNITTDIDYYNLENYLFSDLISTFIVIKRFLSIFEQLGISNINCLTIGSAAMKYMMIYLSKYNLLLQNNINIYLYLRRSYYGGRTICFKPCFNVKNIPSSHDSNYLYYLDVNGLYTYCMENNLFPTGKYIFKETMSIQDAFDYMQQNVLFIATVVLKRNNNNKYQFSVMPVLYDGKLSYKTEKIWSGCINSIDLQQMLDYGYNLYEINNIIIWKTSEHIFKECMKTLHNIKSKYKNSLIYYPIKLLLNSCYGKFGEKIHYKKFYIKDKSDKQQYNYSIDIFNGRKLVYKESTNMIKYPIEIASFITAYTRRYVNKIFNILGVFNYKNNIWYHDVDSFIVNQAGFNILKEKKYIDINHLKIPGKLTVEYYNISFAIFLGPKKYFLEYLDNNIVKSVYKIKGIKNISTISKQHILDLFLFKKKIEITQKQFSVKKFSIKIHNIQKTINYFGPVNALLDLTNNIWNYNHELTKKVFSIKINNLITSITNSYQKNIYLNNLNIYLPNFQYCQYDGHVYDIIKNYEFLIYFIKKNIFSNIKIYKECKNEIIFLNIIFNIFQNKLGTADYIIELIKTIKRIYSKQL